MKLYPLLFLVGIVSLVALTGRVSISWPGRASADPTKGLEDVAMLRAATNSSDGLRAGQEIFVLLDRAHAMRGPRGARLIREQLPPLDARVEAGAPILHQRLSAIDLRTSQARTCRTALLRGYEQERWFLYTLTDEVAHSRSTWPVVRRFQARWHRWVVAHGRLCSFNY